MTTTMFYERPVPLNRERHQGLRIAPAPGHYRFAARTNAVPIAGSEFAAASRSYPIVFVSEEGGPVNVAALVGLRDGDNLFVDAEGQWEKGAYVPAFARSYPFVLARSDATDRLAVCVDEVYAGLGEGPEGEALFDEQGKETAYLQRVVGFLQSFHTELQQTKAFTQRLQDLGLLVPKIVHMERQDQPRQTLSGMWIVDTTRLRALDDLRVVELYRSGHLPWIEAHLISMGHLPMLITRMDERPGGGTDPRPSAGRDAGHSAPGPGQRHTQH